MRITELRKITALASNFGGVVAPHACESCSPNVHFMLRQPHCSCPLAEWNVRVNAHRQYFYRDLTEPREGYFWPPTEPGLGWDLDPAKIGTRTELCTAA